MYHFIDNRKSNSHWLKSLFTVFVWIPYAIRLLRKKFAAHFSNSKPTEVIYFTLENETLLEKTKKELECVFAKDIKVFSAFEFRETTERYIGLTIACRTENQKPTDKEIDLFQISGSDNKILAAKCLHRRNLKLLNFHHSLARRDFLKFICKYKDDISDAENFYRLLFKFIRTLQDVEAENIIKNNFTFIAQSVKDTTVTDLEKEIWTPEIPKPQLVEMITSPLKAMTAPTNLPYKD